MPDRPSTLERLVFFSDAVFAIAITLLAIDIRLPAGVPDTEAALAAALAELRPELFAFALSFGVVGAFWLGHLRTLRVVQRADGRFVLLNLVFLFFIALLPFPTSVVARHGDLPLGTSVYAAFIAATGLASLGVWVYATGPGGLAPELPEGLARANALRVLVVPVLFLLSIPASLVNPLLADVFWVASFPAQAIVTRLLGIGAEIDHSLSAG